jgi:caffeoyl-CoA O-methyltransferase
MALSGNPMEPATGGTFMQSVLNTTMLMAALFTLAITGLNPLPARGADESAALDERVRKFLERHRGQWHDFNVPAVDGKMLYELIVKHRFQSALEIGTSTGYSAVWIAWALTKTGGRLITVEIDESRYRQALANFEEAGLLPYIDARLADAHELVNKLDGPFDFVFSDADKEWYTNYFRVLAPKLKPGGCFTAHNVRMSWAGIGEFLDYVNGLADFETTIDKSSSAGISISCKKPK